ncbi:MAG TPA: L,D-transpeptidase family protein [Sphingomicrobium sp.]|nr:L,D-transpeptidase family protein [Sphingomicrobium sp.]
MLRFNKLFVAAVAAAALAALSACSIVTERPQVRQPFGWGYTLRAQQQLMTKFDRSAFKAGDYVWTRKKLGKGATEVVISLSRQIAYVYHAGDLVGASSISTGMAGHETPVGRFPIMQKDRDHKSNRYSNAPMPYMQRLTEWGIALHGGDLPGYAASHGCIRLPMAFAKKLYALTDLDDMVYIEE